MKTVGVVLIGVGLALFVFLTVSLIQNNNRLISPVPDNKGIRVIFVTPTK